MTAPALSPTLALACELINRPSVTPLDEGCQQLMSQRLAACGFAIEPMHIEDVENFWAIRGNEGPVLCFAGHTDVVPPLGMWAGLGAFNIIAFVLVARSADRFAHARRSQVLCESFERIINMPLAWHHTRGTSNSLHTLLRAVETLFSLQ